MSKFNLIEEPWLMVMTDDKGTVETVSLKQLFENASQYKRLAGETSAQDFAVLRLLLAILHTVFSRFNDHGEPYKYIELDEKLIPKEDIDEDDESDYSSALTETWEGLWQSNHFPPIVTTYLEKWKDRFYLLDEQYPFYQVSHTLFDTNPINYKSPSLLSAKTANLTISESGNKVSLFSPKNTSKFNKEIMSYEEISRWLITLQGYVSLGDKTKFISREYPRKISKGWLYDLGGIMLEGETLYETLLLNLVLIHPNEQFRLKIQRPSWERFSESVVDRLFNSIPINNLAELYTNWSRAVYINPNVDISQPFSYEIVKLPGINHQNQFLELMTLWRFNKNGENKGSFTPKKHDVNQSFWRSFGLVALPNTPEQHRPGIIEWLIKIGESDKNLKATIQSISLKDDGNAPSWLPVDEIYDCLNIKEKLIIDDSIDGWLVRLNEVIDQTKYVIDVVYKHFLSDIRKIRNNQDEGFEDTKIQEAFFAIDQPFRAWLMGIDPVANKEETIYKWEKRLKMIIRDQANELQKNSGKRDYIGIQKDGKMFNIATAYNNFEYQLNKKLPGRSKV